MHGLRPWSRAIIATVLLALATVLSVTAAGKQDQAAASSKGNNVTANIVSGAAPAPPLLPSMNVSAICRSTPYPRACETALSSPASSTRDDPFAASVQFAMARHVNKHKAGAGGGTPAPAPPMATTFPSWVSQHDRNLLESPAGGATSGVAVDAVVALDGSGTHRSINEAIAAVTAGGGGGGGRKVIHVKAGRYEESVSISSKQKNVMLMGDGKGKTVIVGHKSAADGYTTYATATVAAMGSGFIAKGLTIINSAGPGKGQAVALRVGGDLSVVYQCAIQAYQDTLYVHSNRQFYAEDDIAGTVDFIFGNSAVAIQNCDIQARRPSPGQQDTVTAQGRTDPNQNTGISIHKCRITGASDLGSMPVYLGRPWQKYSRTVVMESFLDRSISPAGWLEWSGQFALSTLYYGEYGNTGVGAGTSKRVTWPGVHTSLSRSDASRFTVANFIMGDSWLGGTGVTYTSGL
ncbi:unnamed protein product [Urochloa humidicola]